MVSQLKLIECEIRLLSWAHKHAHTCHRFLAIWPSISVSLSTQQWLSVSFCQQVGLGLVYEVGFWCELLRLVTGSETRGQGLAVGGVCPLTELPVGAGAQSADVGQFTRAGKGQIGRAGSGSCSGEGLG